MNNKTIIIGSACMCLLGVLTIYFVGNLEYSRGFRDGCDATRTAYQLI